MGEHDVEGSDAMSAEDEKVVEALTEAEVATIDKWVLSSVDLKWKKVAKIVAQAIEMSDETGLLLEVPDLFFAMRVHHHCKAGNLEIRGDTNRMRFCEARRVASSPSNRKLTNN